MIGETKVANLRWCLRTFAFLINTGISLHRSMSVLEESALDNDLRSALREVHADIMAGATLSKSMTRFKQIFPSFVTVLVRAGEIGGVLDETLERAADYAEHEARLGDFKGNEQALLTFQLSLWARQLGCLLTSGVPILQTLEVVAEMSDRQELREATLFMRTAVREGDSMTSVVARHPTVFPSLVKEMVEVGESTGALDKICVHLADHLEKFAEEIPSRDARTDKEEPKKTSPAPETSELEEPESSSVTATVEEILTEAIKVGASDIHLQPARRTARLRFRVDGVLHPGPDIFQDLDSYWPVLNRLKSMAGLDVAQRRLPQRGRAPVRIEETDYDLRVASYPTTNGEAVTLRVQSPPARALTLSELGWESQQEQQITFLLRQPCGIIVVAGPNGSGRSTTLNAMLEHLNNVEKCIVTVEETISREIPGVHRSTTARLFVTPAMLLRALTRQDADVVMVEEVRDRETFEMVVELALSGHLVLIGLTCNHAAAAVEHLMSFSPEPLLLTDALIGVTGQRLVRKVCESCAENVPPDANLALSLGINEIALSQAEVRRGSGCGLCGGTGVKGRIAAFEILTLKPGRLLSLIKKGADPTRIRSAALAEGFYPLQTAILAKALRGVASPEEAMRLIAAADSE